MVSNTIMVLIMCLVSGLSMTVQVSIASTLESSANVVAEVRMYC